MELLGVPQGESVELDRVLLVADGDKVAVGTPVVEGAKVVATSQGEDKGDKVIVFKYKNKVRYRVKRGHRQPYTRLSIDNIVAAGIEPAKTEKPKQAVKPKKEVAADGA